MDSCLGSFPDCDSGVSVAHEKAANLGLFSSFRSPTHAPRENTGKMRNVLLIPSVSWRSSLAPAAEAQTPTPTETVTETPTFDRDADRDAHGDANAGRYADVDRNTDVTRTPTPLPLAECVLQSHCCRLSA